MYYQKVVEGIFKERPNRFIAFVYVNQVLETVHVKNTGRCRELLIPGARVVLEESDHPNRKTKYDLIAVYKDGIGLINMDSQAPNKVVGEWLQENTLFKNITYIKPEYKYGNSRVDFYFEYQQKKVLMEVKGVTLEIDKIAYFPDAPTERGVKHIRELERAVKEGYECYLAFVIQMQGVDIVYPNTATHREFAEALEHACKAGVRLIYLGCDVKENALNINRYFIPEGDAQKQEPLL
ncbi:MAG: DNA/RNA nuclease SfsA [Lachnospiraceae bacterium]|nr:DNA/RNA nuclease SfsA [Lachnospiraceae bacterium]